MSEERVNRNAPCPCGSGKKYKKCCHLIEHQEDSPKKLAPGNHPTKPLHIENLFNLTVSELENIFLIPLRKIQNEYDLRDFIFSLREFEENFMFFGFENKSWNRREVSLRIRKNGEIQVGSSIYEREAAIFLLHSLINENSSIYDALSPIKKTLNSLFLNDFTPIEFKGFALSHPEFRPSKRSAQQSFTVPHDDDLFFVTPRVAFDEAEFKSNQKLERYPQLSNLLFLFSDGQALSLIDMIYHPYRILCEENFSELKKTAVGNIKKSHIFQDVRWSDSWYFESNRGNTVLMNCIDHIKNRTDVFLARSDTEKIKLHPTDKIEHLTIPSSDQKVEVTTDEALVGTLNVKLDKNKLTNPESHHEDFYWDNKSKTLQLQHSRSSFDIIDDGLSRDLNWEHTVSYNHEKLQFNINGHPDPSVILNSLDRMDIPYDNLLPPSSDLDTKFRVHIHSSARNQITIDLLFKVDESIEAHSKICHFSKKCKGVLRSFSEGLCGYWNSEARAMAVKSLEFRANELRLYKHVGFARIVALECLSLMKGLDTGLSSQAISYNKIKKELEPKISQLICRILFKKGGEFLKSYNEIKSHHLSKKFFTNLNKYISGILTLHQERSVYINKDQIFHIHSGDSFLSLIQFTLDELIRNQKDSALLKAKSQGYEWRETFCRNAFLNENDDEFDNTHSLHFQNPISLFNARLLGDVFIDGVRIEVLTSEDLRSELNIESQNKRDWFELHPTHFFRGQEISLEMAQQFSHGELVEFKGSFYQIDPKEVPSMKSLEKFWGRITERRNQQSSFSEYSSIEMKIERSQILELLALKRQGVSVIGDKKWQEISKSFDKLDEDHQSRATMIKNSLQGFQGQLKPFQKEGLGWLHTLCQLGLGGILSDDMGLGKTVQSIALIHCFLKKDQYPPHLVVVPTSLTYNWKQEFSKFSPNIDVCVFEGSRKTTYLELWLSEPPQVVIVTYGLLLEHQDFFTSQKWGITFFDEAQNLKNIKAKRRQVAKELNSTNKIALSGTPIENHYGELFSILDLCVQGALGSYKDFMGVFGSMTKGNVDSKFLMEEIIFLKEKVKPLLLRRTKDMVLDDLPDKVESVIPLQFNKKQEDIYKKTALSWNSQVQHLINAKGESNAQLQMLTALLRLRQICSCPQGVDGVPKNVESPKFKLIVEKVTELTQKNENIILFTNFVKTLDLLSEELRASGVNTLTLCGRDSKSKREKTLKTFNESHEASALLMTLKTGGVGLNLTKANYVFHIEPWWNPAAENQGTDRVHRIGQKRSVHVYRYIMKNSVEEKIQDLKLQKQKAFDMMFQEDFAGLEKTVNLRKTQLTQKDFEKLLS